MRRDHGETDTPLRLSGARLRRPLAPIHPLHPQPSFLDCDGSRLSSCFQIDQSLIAVGSGGAMGKGLMAGVQKLYYIPEPHTDFIFSVIGEELGLIGGTVILLCFAVVAWPA